MQGAKRNLQQLSAMGWTMCFRRLLQRQFWVMQCCWVAELHVNGCTMWSRVRWFGALLWPCGLASAAHWNSRPELQTVALSWQSCCPQMVKLWTTTPMAVGTSPSWRKGCCKLECGKGSRNQAWHEACLRAKPSSKELWTRSWKAATRLCCKQPSSVSLWCQELQVVSWRCEPGQGPCSPFQASLAAASSSSAQSRTFSCRPMLWVWLVPREWIPSRGGLPWMDGTTSWWAKSVHQACILLIAFAGTSVDWTPSLRIHRTWTLRCQT